MKKLKISLENCYGIKKLDAEINFSTKSAIAIYAPNGSMKSSLAQTFFDLSKGTQSKDRFFPARHCQRKITDENNADLSKEMVFVVTPYDKDFAHTEKTSTLLVNNNLKKEYTKNNLEVENEKVLFLKTLKELSGSKKDLEKEISTTFTKTDSEFYVALGRVKEEMAKQKEAPFSGIPYDKVSDISKRDYHGLHWLLYIYLQQGRHGKAEELLTVMRQSLAEFPKDAPRNLMFGTFTYASMTAAFVAETEQWDAAEPLLDSPHAKAEDSKSQEGSSPAPMQAYVVVPQIPAIFTRGLQSAVQGSPDAQKYITELTTIREQQSGAKEPFITQVVMMTEIQELEIAAMFNVAKGHFDDAIKSMKQATALEDAMPPPSGPPTVIKPPHELFGEILLRAGRPQEAAQQFATSLRRHPNRARSLLGAARAAAKSGDPQGAAHAYTQFSRQWQQSDAKVPELCEAQDYLKRAGAR
jgi:hypothetical protein